VVASPSLSLVMTTAIEVCKKIADRKVTVCAGDLVPRISQWGRKKKQKKKTYGLSRLRAQRALQGLCQRSLLLRVKPGVYVPKEADTEQIQVPVFPWVGGKRKMAPALVQILMAEKRRQKCARVLSPFTGGGVVEGALRSLQVPVDCSDLDSSLVNTHVVLADAKNREAMAKSFVAEHRRIAAVRSIDGRKAIFKRRLSPSSKPLTAPDPAAAAKFTLALKSVFNGLLGKNPRYDHEKFSSIAPEKVADRIRAHKGLQGCRTRDAFKTIKEASPSALLFVDPPYLLEHKDSQYKAGDFGLQEHQELAKRLKGKAFVLTHRHCKKIAALYPGCRVFQAGAIMQMSKKGASRAEMIIVSRRARKAGKPV
jgi:site-specific DNA-adenine methylase